MENRTRDNSIERSPDDITVAIGSILGRLDNISSLLRDLLLDIEQEPDFDQTYIVGGGNVTNNYNVVPITLPRTLRHVEITVTIAQQSANNLILGLFPGNLTLSQAQVAMVDAQTALTSLSAIAVVSSGRVTTRTYLDGSGFLTVYCRTINTGAMFANIRIRSLDATQQRAQRT